MREGKGKKRLLSHPHPFQTEEHALLVSSFLRPLANESFPSPGRLALEAAGPALPDRPYDRLVLTA